MPVEDKENATRSLQEAAARKLQKCFRRSSLWAHCCSSIANRAKTQEALPASTGEDRERCLREARIAELRIILHKPPGCGPDGRPVDEACRILELLFHFPVFESILSLLPPRAQVCVGQSLFAVCVEPGDLVFRAAAFHPRSFQQLVDMGLWRINTGNSDQDLGEGDLACLLLSGEGVWQAEGASGRLDAPDSLLVDQNTTVVVGAELCGSPGQEVRSSRRGEVLRLVLPALTKVAAAEHQRDRLRDAALQVLRSRAPCCRERSAVATVYEHLQTLECLQGLEEEAAHIICQQAEIQSVKRGSCLFRAGDMLDGLHILLRGRARAVFGPRDEELAEPQEVDTPPASRRSSRPGWPLAGWPFAFWEDSAMEEWLLCSKKEARHLFTAVALEDSEVLFVARALYCRHIRPVRAASCLGTAALCMLAAHSNLLVDRALLAPATSDIKTGRVSLPTQAETKADHLLSVASVAVDGMLSIADHVSLPPLRVFSQRVRRRFCGKARLLRAGNGEVLFREGEQATAWMVLLRGTVGIFKQHGGLLPAEAARHGSIRDLQRLPREFFSNLLVLLDSTLWRHGAPQHNADAEWLGHLETLLALSRPNTLTATSLRHHKLAEGLLDICARSWKGLPSRSSSAAGLPQRVLWSDELAQRLLGREPKTREPPDGEQFVPINEIGSFCDLLGPGSLLDLTAYDPKSASPPHRQTAVALGHRAELLVFEMGALGKVLQQEELDLPDGKAVQHVLQSRTGPERTPEDLHMLDTLLCKHEAFQHLEHLDRAHLCRSMDVLEVPAGVEVCRQGQEANEFFQVLQGSVAVYMNLENDLEEHRSVEDVGERPSCGGRFLLSLGVGSSFGEQALLGEVEEHPQTLVAATASILARIRRGDHAVTMRDWRRDRATRQRALGALCGHEVGDFESLLRVLQTSAEWISSLDAEHCWGLARRALLVHVPAGEPVMAALRDAQVREGEDPDAAPLPFCIVLRGCIGRYELESMEQPPATEDSEEASQAQNLEPSHEVERSSSPLRGTGVTASRLAELRLLAQDLSARITHCPLETSLQDRLRLHSYHHRIGLLERAPNATLARASVAPSSPAGESADYDGGPDVPSGEGSAVVRRPGERQPPDQKALARPLRSLPLEWLPKLSDCAGEIREGGSFGGSEVEGALKMGELLFRAHADTALLVLTRRTCQRAQEALSSDKLSQRVEMLQRWLPGMSGESIERLQAIPEVRQKGSTLLQEGCQSDVFWLITEGHCCCSACPRTSTAKGIALNGLYDSGAETDGQTGTSAATLAPVSEKGPRGPLSLAILKPGHFIGLASAVLHSPEPCTVIVTSPQVRLLAIRVEHCLRFSPQALEGLRRLARAQQHWCASQLEQRINIFHACKQRFAEAQDEGLLEMPRVLDSPFLRRQMELRPGLAQLDVVCQHFGQELHPEASWVVAPQTRTFFQGMRLLCGTHQEAPGLPDVAATPRSKAAAEKFKLFGRLGADSQREALRGPRCTAPLASPHSQTAAILAQTPIRSAEAAAMAKPKADFRSKSMQRWKSPSRERQQARERQEPQEPQVPREQERSSPREQSAKSRPSPSLRRLQLQRLGERETEPSRFPTALCAGAVAGGSEVPEPVVSLPGGLVEAKLKASLGAAGPAKTPGWWPRGRDRHGPREPFHADETLQLGKPTCPIRRGPGVPAHRDPQRPCDVHTSDVPPLTPRRLHSAHFGPVSHPQRTPRLAVTGRRSGFAA